MNISYDSYRVFYYAAKYRSFSQAAAALYSNQPNVTRMIRKLESELGCALFFRSPQGVRLTPEGEKLYTHIAVAFESIEAGEEEVLSDQSLQSGIVHIAASSLALRTRLLQVLARYRRAYPHVRICLTNHSASHGLAAVQNGLADFAILAEGASVPDSLTAQKIDEIQEIPICGLAFLELTEEPVSLKRLADYPIISLTEGTSSHDFYAELFLRHGLSFSPDVEVETTAQVPPVVQSDLGVGFVPREMLYGTPEASREWGFYIIPDLKTWATNAEQQTPIEHFATFEEAKARFDELRSQPYNSEAKDLNTDGRPYAHLTLGMESKDGMSAADILHVRAGQNYLVEDFTRMERLRSDPVVLESLSRVAQEIGFDRVRPYVVENGSYKAMPDMPFTQWENPYFTVDPPAQEQGDTFTIYQLKGGPETRDYRFEAYESLQEAGLAVDRQNYDLVYTAPLDGKTTLEDIYRTFNLDRPADFTGHSLSVSDVVVLNRSGKEEAHYCDSFGFTPVPEFFLQREKQLTPRELLTGESIQTPRGSFLVTDMSREQLEAAGYGFHHQSEDGKYLIMGNGTDAFAIPAQQESPIKAAEMTTEQNYNMIDGVLNNAPTMSELEAKAKAGEQISLFDVAEAAKAEAQKPKQPQRPAQKQKKPSIRAQLKAAKEEQQKKPPQREKAQELEV